MTQPPSTHSTRTRRASSALSRRAAAVLAATALLTLAALGCGDGPLAPGEKEGTGTITASGAVTASGSGLALFQSVSIGGTSLFQILVAPAGQATTNTWELQIANYSGRLAAGTYRLSALSPSSPDPTASFYYVNGGTMDLYNSTSGELVITSSSPSAVKGTFTFTATRAGSTPSTVTAQGSFNAKCAPGLACL
jgi:Family of unknown function (DUF6252)